MTNNACAIFHEAGGKCSNCDRDFLSHSGDVRNTFNRRQLRTFFNVELADLILANIVALQPNGDLQKQRDLADKLAPRMWRLGARPK